MSEEKKEVKAEEKKEKKQVEVKVITLNAGKANSKSSIHPATGTRFEPTSARQYAFDIIVKMIKENKSIQEIRKALAETKKPAAQFSLDAGYLNYVVACHPEFFRTWNNGKIELIKTPTPDPEAARLLEEEKKKKKEKAEKAREERRAKAAEAKAEKAEKREKKVEGDKPSKKEKEG